VVPMENQFTTSLLSLFVFVATKPFIQRGVCRRLAVSPDCPSRDVKPLAGAGERRREVLMVEVVPPCSLMSRM